LLDLAATPGEITEAGLRNNVSVGLQYLTAWLGGNAAVAINNLMEDAATAEISRSQIWQWVRHGVRLADGRPVTGELVNEVIEQELAAIRDAAGPAFDATGYAQAAALFRQVALSAGYEEFLTVPAYERMP
jgi:malate synthase